MADPTTPPVHFLLVDDREANLIALEALLRRDGLNCLKAHSGLEALEMLLRHDVALALVDVQMPDMDGFELAELMRGTERTRRVPIIFLTAGTDLQRKFRGYEAGAVDFLTKPIEADILKSKAEVFFELFRQRQEVARQRDELASMIEQNSRLLAETRQAAEALQEADRRKDEFLATLAHELRNPLAPILSAIQFLRFSGDASPEVTEFYEIIERQVNHMVRLVDDLLEVSRITSGKIQLKPGRMDLADAVRHAVETSKPLMEAGRHELTVALPDMPLPVEGDMVRLTQVLANLLNNAAKYTPEGGRVTVTVTRDGGHALVSIRDTGMGIPAEMLHKVFEMFTQINRHLKRSQGGLGIGLSLVKRLVDLHGGDVTVTSDGEGFGTEFTVRLPLTDVVQQQSFSVEGVPQLPHAAQRILIIDDNVDGSNSLRKLLSLSGHDVATAHSGPQGIDEVGRFRPTVVLLDLGMPGMDGYETARHIRALPGGRGVTLIALTGWGQAEDRTRTQEAGFDFHLVKPVNSSALLHILPGVTPVGAESPRNEN